MMATEPMVLVSAVIAVIAAIVVHPLIIEAGVSPAWVAIFASIVMGVFASVMALVFTLGLIHIRTRVIHGVDVQ